eukprot:TRINITY_DN1533_c0_g2_i1.p1 TRINITY_DN1533_c0_g2~~TRINITY_DN1533_c0_g2_i1.p1  ORF type:complete len:148 (+),score=36.01 TRINITY_DN1533_c0_g2_i1:140-583(+)
MFYSFVNSDIFSLTIKAGDVVDALVVNDRVYGGDGGAAVAVGLFKEPAHIVKIQYRLGAVIDYVRLTMSDGTVLSGGGNGGDWQDKIDVAEGVTIEVQTGMLWSIRVVESIQVRAPGQEGAPEDDEAPFWAAQDDDNEDNIDRSQMA